MSELLPHCMASIVFWIVLGAALIWALEPSVRGR